MDKASPYEPLWQYIRDQNGKTLKMPFSQIEALLGFPINHAFLNYKNELSAYGWFCLKISLKEQYITFLRLPNHSKILEKSSFTVLGKEGSTDDGPGFIQRLWDNANSHFNQIEPFAKKNKEGKLCGIWGAMTDFSRSFKPWEANFSRGLYLAGVECIDAGEPPDGWACWVLPAFTYLAVENRTEQVFATTIAFLKTNKLPLAGAVQEFTDPQTQKAYLLFPINRR